MGCAWFKFKLPWFKSSSFSLEEAPVKQYSWDKRDNLNKEDYIIKNLTDQKIIKNAGSINGQQFIIQNCKGCSIVLMDHSSSVTIDECFDCFIFIAPVKTSCFIRDSSDCQLVVACQQLRTRDCKKLQIHLCCTSQPSIEASTNLAFQCYQCYYPLIAEHFSSAALNEYNNNWSNIHDFTPTTNNQLNYSILPVDTSYERHLNSLSASLSIFCNPSSSFVPFTHALPSPLLNERCLVIFQKDSAHKNIINNFLLLIKQEGCVLVRSREVECSLQTNERLFSQTPLINPPKYGSFICLEIVGKNASTKSNMAVNKTLEIMANNVLAAAEENSGSGEIGTLGGRFGKRKEEGFVYVSDERESATMLTNFHSLVKAQMGF